MPFDGSGNFNRVFNWATDKANSINITASRVDTEDTGFATGLSNCLTRDGQGKPTAPINWNNQTITNILSLTLNQDPTSALQAATKQYVDNNIQLSPQDWGATAGGTANAITLTLAPVPAAYAAGMRIAFITGASPNSGAVTVAVNGLAAKNLVRSDGIALANADLPATSLVVARYDAVAGNFKIETISAAQLAALLASVNTWAAAQTMALSGAAPLNLRRTENDTTLRKALSIQSGSGAGNDYSLSEIGDASNNVAFVNEQIGATIIRQVSSGSQLFQIPTDLNEIATPGNPASGRLRTYAKSGLCALYGIEGASGSEHLLGPLALASARGLSIINNVGTPNTQIDITVSEAILTDSNGIGVYYSGGTLTINAATTGANALDTGALANATWYFLYLIYNPATNTFASLASTSSSAPTMPSGYTAKMRVGAFQTDGSAHFYRIIQVGRHARYVITAATNTATFPFTGSNATSTFTSQTARGNGFAAPTTASEVELALVGNTASSGSWVRAAANGAYTASSGPTNPTALTGAIVTNWQGAGYGYILLESNAIFISGNDAAAKVQFYGWMDAVNAV